jgi:hypothetical protein
MDASREKPRTLYEKLTQYIYMSMFRSKIIEPRCTQGDLSPASTVPVTRNLPINGLCQYIYG